MPDRSAENLERIRACDAGWNESDHPRSENGQFTSGGGGVKTSKLPEGKTTAHNTIKAGQIAKNQEHYDKTHKKWSGIYLNDLTNAVKKGDYEAAKEALESHESDKKQYDKHTAKNNKFKAAAATLANARPKIQAMRQLAQAARSEAHPMAAEVKNDIDYWNQTHYGGNPSEKQKADTIESIRMQYESAAKKAEKFYKMASQASGIDPAKVKEFKDKWETAKGKAEALAQMNK